MAGWQVTEVQRYLKGADYPLDGKGLSALAERNGADGDLVEALSGIGRSVDGPSAVMQELAGDLGGPTPGGGRDDGPREDVERPAFQVDDVQRYLGGADYPASGEALAGLARSNGTGSASSSSSGTPRTWLPPARPELARRGQALAGQDRARARAGPRRPARARPVRIRPPRGVHAAGRGPGWTGCRRAT